MFKRKHETRCRNTVCVILPLSSFPVLLQFISTAVILSSSVSCWKGKVEIYISSVSGWIIEFCPNPSSSLIRWSQFKLNGKQQVGDNYTLRSHHLYTAHSVGSRSVCSTVHPPHVKLGKCTPLLKQIQHHVASKIFQKQVWKVIWWLWLDPPQDTVCHK